MFRLSRKDRASRNEVVEVIVSNQTVLRVIGLVVATVVVFAAVRKAEHALVLVFTAFFLTLALNAPVQWLARHLPGNLKGKRSVATTISFLVIVALLGGFIASIAPPLVKQTQNFISTAPHLVSDLHNQNSELGKLVRHYHLENQIDTFSGQLSDRLKNLSGSAVTTTTRIGTSIFSVLTILVLTFMMLIEGPRWLRFIRELLPTGRREHADHLAFDMYRVIKGFINGQVILAAVAAALIVPALFILHISYPIALMVIIFVCGLIPMVGHTIGAIIVTTIALFHSPTSAIIILSYYILYQQIENYVVQPRIQANSTDMSPLTVFLSVVIGVSFGGLFGGLFAIPIGGCLRILLLDYLRSHEFIADKPTIRDEEVKAGTI